MFIRNNFILQKVNLRGKTLALGLPNKNNGLFAENSITIAESFFIKRYQGAVKKGEGKKKRFAIGQIGI